MEAISVMFADFGVGPMPTSFLQLEEWMGVMLGWGKTIKVADVVEWGGTAFGMAGAALLAVNCSASRFGWLLFWISNVFWIAFGLMFGHKGFTLQQFFFVLTSSLGVYRWIVFPRVQKKRVSAINGCSQ